VDGSGPWRGREGKWTEEDYGVGRGGSREKGSVSGGRWVMGWGREREWKKEDYELEEEYGM
jgi:hypothetical protein